MQDASGPGPAEGREFTGIWRAKWIAEGARSLDEIVSNLEGAAAELRAMRDDGVELAGPVEDDYGTLVTRDPAVAEKYGLYHGEGDEVEEEEGF